MKEKSDKSDSLIVPVLTEPYPHYKWPYIDETLKTSILNQLEQPLSERDNTGTIGVYERELKSFYQTKHVLTFSSGTGALHAACIACGLNPSDELIAPNYTFFATFSAFAFEGVKIVLCDSDKQGNIDPDEISRKVTPKTKAVIVTHMWGIPCDMNQICELCK